MKNSVKKNAELFSFKYLIYDLAKITAALPGLIWYRPKFIYENDAARKKIRGGALLIANHHTLFDPVHIMMAIWYRRHHFVCYKELYDKAKWIFKPFMCIPIDRNNFSFDSFHKIIDSLRSGQLVCMFPEGRISRNINGRLTDFKSGMVLMALKSKRPVIPIYIREKKHFYSRLVSVIGEPVDICALCGESPDFSQIEKAAEILRQKEESLRSLLTNNDTPMKRSSSRVCRNS